MNHFRSAVGIILSAMLPLSAQSNDEVVPSGDHRLAWFIQTGIPEGLDNPVMVMTGKKIELVTLSNRLASGPVKIPPDGVIRLVREIQDPMDPKKSIYLNLAEAKIPETMKQALVILVPSVADPATSRIFHVRTQGLSNFNGGDCLYLNLTNLDMIIEIGDKKIPLKPGNLRILDGSKADQAVDVPFRYSYYHPTLDKWRVLSASVTIMSPTRREIVVFGIDQNTSRVKCSNITFPVRHLGE
jgi:hypothetical protein